MLEEKNEKQNYLEVCNTNPYYLFREKLSIGGFCLEDGEKWYQAELVGKSTNATAYIKPDSTTMLTDKDALREWQDVTKTKYLSLKKHGDLATDILDIIIAKWLKEAMYFENSIDITVDEILQARGLKKKINSKGRRGGYSARQKEEILNMIDTLSYVWIKVNEMEIIQIVNGKRNKVKWKGESKAIVLSSRIVKEEDGRSNAFAWRVRPGDIFAKYLFGIGRQTALLSQKALSYDPYRQKWEKRLTRYFAWLWRISDTRTKRGLLVRKLIHSAGMTLDEKRPSRTRKRFEDALNLLRADGVISSWHYDKEELKSHNSRGWCWKDWLNCKVIITAPEEIVSHYEQMRKKKKG